MDFCFYSRPRSFWLWSLSVTDSREITKNRADASVFTFSHVYAASVPAHSDSRSVAMSLSRFTRSSNPDFRYLCFDGPYAIQDAFCLAQRALAAFRALRRRCSGVMLAARALPPIFPPSRPSSDRICERRERTGSAAFSDDPSGSLGRSPSNLCTAMKPAWTSSSGSLPDGFRIHYKRGTFGRLASSLRKSKVAHYRRFGRRASLRAAS